MKYRQSSESQSIRQNFRKQIRRKQIEQFFATKRKLVSDYMEENNLYKPKRNLVQLFENVKSLMNLDDNLANLGNYLYQTQCLSKTQQIIGKKNTQDLCLKIANTILTTIMPMLFQRTQQNENNRKKCLTIISNIMADSLSPHNQLVPIIIQGINHNYTQLSQSNSQQVTQIGWIIANTLCHNLDLSVQSDLQKPIQQILTLAQQLILIPNLQMINILYRSLRSFFISIDNYFHANNKQVQHYKIHRLILLQNTVTYNLSIQFGTTLISILSFIESNLIYANSCQQKLSSNICMKCFKILSCTSSDKIMSATFKLISQLIKDKQIIVTIVKDYFHIIQNCLMYHGINIKIDALRLLIYLCTEKQITIFMVQNKQLEIILCELIKGLRDTQALQQLMILTKVIIDETDKKCGINALMTIQQHLCHKVGPVGQFATALVTQFQDQIHKNKMI